MVDSESASFYVFFFLFLQWGKETENDLMLKWLGFQSTQYCRFKFK